MKLLEGIAYSVLRKAKQVETHPFPHVVIQNALPFWLYDHLVKVRPKVEGSGSNKRFDMRAAHALNQNLDPLLAKFIEYHCSERFYQEVDSLFRLGLSGKVGMRYRDKTPIRLDCQISINTPVEEESRVCEAHVDNPETRWAGLLYMPDANDTAGGDLELFDCPNPEFYGKRRVKNPGEPVKVVQYAPNTFVCFKNSTTAVHRTTPRKPTPITRKFMNFVIDA